MNSDYWKKYIRQREESERLHQEHVVPKDVEAPKKEAEEIEEEVHEEVLEQIAPEPKPKTKPKGGPVEGQVRNNGLQIFRNGKWGKRFPNHW